MINTPNIPLNEALDEAVHLIYQEHLKMREGLDYKQLAAVIPYLEASKRIFLMGMGRSGLMMQAAAMRLMHLGYEAYVVGETTTPAIAQGDLLLAGSGSGSTTSIVNAAKTAKREAAKVVAITTNPESLLADLADQVLLIPAAEKNKQEEAISKQYAGSLFEQSLLLVTDALIQVLWHAGGKTADELWKRHSNLE
ncbi:6-phospho-3-hexuloisomerase [Leeuwenhoekiella marinoflava]|uniref:3-hexulose-6-phosphate isomerase n=2 Tax=Leeuwenhoekiella marinoflava TaxID=988 RepID=A0A4V1KRS4_9FLAO|nr:6-phospho-3-hexuloisomerase [Leeuwenhoekiella marinoflava]RXG25922.1 3-hexulose-6-phosphate isomerase [Leeuwenhoekiella marinoflava]SHF28264.1 6-phospho-3-hexuloisomerase [Leeuwenhoekiella marinoflava DSM 3653]